MINDTEKVLNFWNTLFEKDKIRDIVISEFSLFHIKEIDLLVQNNTEAFIIKANYCTSFCGNLKKWKNPSLILSRVNQIIELTSRNIDSDVFRLQDTNNGYGLNCKNIYYEKAPKSSLKLLNDPPINYSNSLIETNTNEIANLLLKWENNCFRVSNSNADNIRLISEDEEIFDFLNPKPKSSSTTKLIIECRSPVFCCLDLISIFRVKLRIKVVDNMYVIYSQDNRLEIKCQDISARESNSIKW